MHIINNIVCILKDFMINTSIFGREAGEKEGVARPHAEPGWCYHVPCPNYFILVTELYTRILIVFCTL